MASIFNRNEIPFFVEQMSAFNAALQEGGKLHEAHRFMMEMKEEENRDIGIEVTDSSSSDGEGETKIQEGKDYQIYGFGGEKNSKKHC